MGKKEAAGEAADAPASTSYADKARFCSVIAKPLAEEKLCKRVLKLCKKATKRKQIRRGVKEVVKALRKKQKGCVVGVGGVKEAGGAAGRGRMRPCGCARCGCGAMRLLRAAACCCGPAGLRAWAAHAQQHPLPCTERLHASTHARFARVRVRTRRKHAQAHKQHG